MEDLVEEGVRRVTWTACGPWCLGLGQKVGSGLSAWAWNVVFVIGAVSGAIIAARYYVVGVLTRDRTLSRWAAAMFFVFTIAAVLYFWRFW